MMRWLFLVLFIGFWISVAALSDLLLRAQEPAPQPREVSYYDNRGPRVTFPVGVETPDPGFFHTPAEFIVECCWDDGGELRRVFSYTDKEATLFGNLRAMMRAKCDRDSVRYVIRVWNVGANRWMRLGPVLEPMESKDGWMGAEVRCQAGNTSF